MQNGVEPYLAAHAEEFYWERESGHPIHVLRYRAFRPRGVVVISHGFTENAEKYRSSRPLRPAHGSRTYVPG